jgi:HK97 family phage major capsid protein
MTMRNTDFAAKIDEFGEGIEKFKERYDGKVEKLSTENAALLERIELIEANRSGPGKTGSGPGQPKPYKEFHTAAGTIYEIPSNVKVSDVIKSSQKPEVSFERWLAAALIGERSGDREAIAYAKTFAQITTTSTGVLIPEQYQAQWIDLIRAQMILNAAGMVTIPLEAKTLNASAVATDPPAVWHTEADTVNVGNPTFEPRTMTAQTLAVRCTGSIEVAQDSPDFGAQLAGVMARSIAAELDRVGLVGSGSPPEPQGLLGTSGVNQILSVGSITDYTDLLSGVRLLLEAGVPLEIATKVVIMSPSTWATYEGLPTGISSDKSPLPRPRSLESTQFLVTSGGLDQGSPATSTAFVGNFQDLALGIRREASVEAVKLQSYATNLLIEFIGYVRAAYLVRRPKSFATLEGISVS